FWIPKLAGKRDVVPGRINNIDMEASVPGTYWGQCAEFCGLSHANMRMRVIAQTPADFEKWMANQQRLPVGVTEGLAAAGRELFENRPNAPDGQQCVGCHTIRGISTGRVGPNLTHFASRNIFAARIFERNDEDVAAWLRNPPGEKPGSIMPNLQLNEDEIAKLVAYLESLK